MFPTANLFVCGVLLFVQKQLFSKKCSVEDILPPPLNISNFVLCGDNFFCRTKVSMQRDSTQDPQENVQNEIEYDEKK